MIDTFILILNGITHNINNNYYEYYEMEQFILNKIPDEFPFTTKDVILVMDKYKDDLEFKTNIEYLYSYFNNKLKEKEALDIKEVYNIDNYNMCINNNNDIMDNNLNNYNDIDSKTW